MIAQNVGSRMISGEGSERRPLRYGDLAILFPPIPGLNYEEALRSRGIPTAWKGASAFTLREEIAAQRIYSQPSTILDAVSLAAALRYWGGISDAELYAYKQSGEYWTTGQKLIPASPHRRAVCAAQVMRTRRGTAARSPRWWKACCDLVCPALPRLAPRRPGAGQPAQGHPLLSASGKGSAPRPCRLLPAGWRGWKNRAGKNPNQQSWIRTVMRAVVDDSQGWRWNSRQSAWLT